MTLSLTLQDRLVVIVGGGQVGLRKAQVVDAVGARIRLVDLRAKPVDLPAAWEWVQAPFADDLLDGASLVIAAATVAVNAVVVQACQVRGLWVADAITPALGNVQFPAVGHLGRLHLAVDTDGVAPALAVQLRDRWLAELGPNFADWLEILSETRRELRQKCSDTHQRQALMRELSQLSWWETFQREGEATIREQIALRLAGIQSLPK